MNDIEPLDYMIENKSNILFKDAKFGDPYISENNILFIYLGYAADHHWLCYEEQLIKYLSDPNNHLSAMCVRSDMVEDHLKKYEKDIDEIDLIANATNEAKKWYDAVANESNYNFWRECFECYIAGYKAALNLN